MVHHCAAKLTENLGDPPLNHKECLRKAAVKLNNLRDKSDEIFFNTEDIKRAINGSEDPEELLQKLWGIQGIKDYFKRRESSCRLEEMILISSTKGPLTEFPHDINKNIYSEIIVFGIANCPDVLKMLLDILVKKGEPVTEKDVLRVSFFFSSLAHGVSRNNNSVAKVKSLVLQSGGLTVDGLDKMAQLGISETGRSTLNSTDLLAEVSDTILRESSKTMSNQSTIDNLDFLSNHMCLEYKQLEREDTSNLRTGTNFSIKTIQSIIQNKSD